MSHTIKAIALGFALLALCLIGAHLLGGGNQHPQLARASLLFIGLWFVGAGINMWVGVAKAGYSVTEEAPIFVVVFAIPAAVAVVAWWTFSRR